MPFQTTSSDDANNDKNDKKQILFENEVISCKSGDS